MKRIIVRVKPTTEVIAIASTQDTAHSLAECISYIGNTNSIYGLFGIRLMDFAELSSTEEGRVAYQSFIEKL